VASDHLRVYCAIVCSTYIYLRLLETKTRHSPPRRCGGQDEKSTPEECWSESGQTLEFSACRDKALLVGWDILLVLNLRLCVMDSAAVVSTSRVIVLLMSILTKICIPLRRRRIVWRLVVIRKSETTRCKDKTLLVGLNTQSSLHVIRGVGGFDLQGDRLADERLDKDLHPITRANDEMGQLLLDVVIRKSATSPRADCLQR